MDLGVLLNPVLAGKVLHPITNTSSRTARGRTKKQEEWDIRTQHASRPSAVAKLMLRYGELKRFF